MAILPGDLELWTGNETVVDSGSLALSLGWQVRHVALQEIVAQGTLPRSVAKRDDLVDEWNDLELLAQQQLENTRSLHEPIAAVGNLSLWDVNLVLNGWLTDGGAYQHPINGTIPGPIPETLVGRIAAILAAVAPPPIWFWAEGLAGQVRVKCVAVPGADSYNVYSGRELLGNVPNHTWNALAVLAGEYEVRMGAVIGGVVGILSFPILVTVT